MINKRSEMKTDYREHMRDGAGVISLTDMGGVTTMPHCRLASWIEIPVGASIGYHDHVKETELYAIVSGEGVVEDGGEQVTVMAGDSVFTPDGNGHSIRNTGTVPLVMVAVITTIG